MRWKSRVRDKGLAQEGLSSTQSGIIPGGEGPSPPWGCTFEGGGECFFQEESLFGGRLVWISGSRALVNWGDNVVWEVKGFLICLGCHWKVLARAKGCWRDAWLRLSLRS